MNRTLLWFATAWTILVMLSNVLGFVGIVIAAPTVWRGLWHAWAILDPLNLWNTIFEVVAFSPAFGAMVWRDWRIARGIGV